MHTTFLKTINGLSIQFNRILFPLRYCIINKEPDSNGMKYFFTKNKTGTWTPEIEDLPKWVENSCDQVHEAIVENEKVVE